jgi:hypothetical protein
LLLRLQGRNARSRTLLSSASGHRCHAAKRTKKRRCHGQSLFWHLVEAIGGQFEAGLVGDKVAQCSGFSTSFGIIHFSSPSSPSTETTSQEDNEFLLTIELGMELVKFVECLFPISFLYHNSHATFLLQNCQQTCMLDIARNQTSESRSLLGRMLIGKLHSISNNHFVHHFFTANMRAIQHCNPKAVNRVPRFSWGMSLPSVCILGGGDERERKSVVE